MPPPLRFLRFVLEFFPLWLRLCRAGSLPLRSRESRAEARNLGEKGKHDQGEDQLAELEQISLG